MPETMLLIQMLVVLLVIGAFAGVLAGLLGVGGGIVLVPAFFYAFQTLGYDGPAINANVSGHLIGDDHRDIRALSSQSP